MTTMLLGETQKDLASAIVDYFSLKQYNVQHESNGLTILECLKQNNYDIVVMEIALPGLDGIDIVKCVRSLGWSMPVLLLSSQYCSDELQNGLNFGADGYLVKPFRLDDLAVRVKAMLRRPALRSEKLLVSGNVKLNTESGTVTRDGEMIHLHPMEFKLLQFLLKNPDQIFSTHALFERVWQKSDCLEDTVRTHIRTLRRKLDSSDRNSIITTVRGFGYKAEIRP